MKQCPCGSDKLYTDCCGLFISGDKAAPSPGALMRSRYTAYSLGDLNYIERTMKGSALIQFHQQRDETPEKRPTWLKLEIIKTSRKDRQGFVEFKAHYTFNDQRQILHERSEFLFENNQWYYVDGITPTSHSSIREEPKIGRNDLCSCASQKKFKKCCGK